MLKSSVAPVAASSLLVAPPSGRAPGQAVRIRCRFKLLPPSIICTF